MRILTISPSYPPRTGGMETYVAALSSELARLGHQVTVLTNRDHPAQPSRAIDHGVRVLRAGGLLEGNGHTNCVPWERAYFSLLTDVAELLADTRFDVLHCHTQVALLLAHLSGIALRSPVAASFHETNPLKDPLGDERTAFILRTCPAQTYLVGSRAFADQARGFGLPADRTTIVPMGVADREHLDRPTARLRLQTEFGIDPSKVLITLIGRLTARKEHHRLLAAHDRMRQRDDTVIVFAGSGNSTDERYATMLRGGLSRRLGTDIHLLENISDAQRDALVDGSDIGTQPSSAEGLGLAVVEFMLAGVPVLVSDVPGLREAVGDVRAALVRTDDPDAYAYALDQLTAQTQSRVLRGHQAAHWARQQFTITRAAKQTVEAYSTMCRAS